MGSLYDGRGLCAFRFLAAGLRSTTEPITALRLELSSTLLSRASAADELFRRVFRIGCGRQLAKYHSHVRPREGNQQGK
jgi:hypothetical protein